MSNLVHADFPFPPAIKPPVIRKISNSLGHRTSPNVSTPHTITDWYSKAVHFWRMNHFHKRREKCKTCHVCLFPPTYDNPALLVHDQYTILSKKQKFNPTGATVRHVHVSHLFNVSLAWTCVFKTVQMLTSYGGGCNSFVITGSCVGNLFRT